MITGGIAQKYYKEQLISLLCTPPLNKRIYDKPFGYSGDYITISHYYKDDYEGQTLYEKLIHRYTLELSISRAVINRLNYFYECMRSVVSNFDSPVYISSIGSGPAKEIIEFLKNPLAERCVFNCVDFEKRAIDCVREKINKFSKATGKKICANFFNYSVLQFLKSRKKGVYPEGQHLIYSAGLFDYLNSKIASRLITKLFSLLTVGGTLIITNIHKDVSARAYLELLGEWNLILRDEEDMLQLAVEIKDFREKTIEVDETNAQLYLILKK